jgi:hypothetical protein
LETVLLAAKFREWRLLIAPSAIAALHGDFMTDGKQP